MNNTLNLSKEIYTQSKIEKAIKDYQSLCEIELEENVKYFSCIFNNCKYSMDLTINEFENYVIDLMNVV